jgi:TRAP-type C4-dicarboxylate transport system permease small subunit
MRLFILVRKLRLWLDRVGTLMNAIAGWLLLFCALLISVEIVARNLVGLTFGASLEISSYILALSITWGLCKALSERQHVRIDLLIGKAPLRLRQYLHAAALGMMLAWCLLLAFGAIVLVADSYDFRATDRSTLTIPLIFPQGAWALGIVIFVMFIVVLLAETLLAIALGRPDHVESILGPRTLDDEAKEAIEAANTTPERRS